MSEETNIVDFLKSEKAESLTKYAGNAVVSIQLSDPYGHFYKVGQAGVTKIEVYNEQGERCPIPWFAVFMGDRIFTRVNAGVVAFVDFGA